MISRKRKWTRLALEIIQISYRCSLQLFLELQLHGGHSIQVDNLCVQNIYNFYFQTKFDQKLLLTQFQICVA